MIYVDRSLVEKPSILETPKMIEEFEKMKPSQSKKKRKDDDFRK